MQSLSFFTVVPTDATLVQEAINLGEPMSVSLGDALILCAAARASCDTLLSEDLAHGSVVDGVRILNPLG